MKFHFRNIFIALVLLLTSCQPKIEKTKIAQVGEVILYLEDIPKEELAAIYESDSSKRVSAFAEQWAAKQYLSSLASQIADNEDNILKMVEDYKNNLYLYELEKKWIEEFNDTIISDEEVQIYYENQKDNFLLRKNIVKIRYIKLDKSTKPAELQKTKTWVFNPNSKNDSLLRQFAEVNAENFFLDEKWLFFDDVIREIPISQNFNQQRYLQSNKQVQLDDNNYYYLVYFTDFKIKDENAPLEMERENIIQYILIQKKTAWIQKRKETVVKEALTKGEIKL